MIPDIFFAHKRARLFLLFLFLSIASLHAQDGKAIFSNKCASCHVMGRDMTGPNLVGVEEKWGNTDQIKVWIKNYTKAIAAGYPRATEVASFSPSAMTIFEGSITDAEIDAILKYIKEWKPAVAPTPVAGEGQPESSGRGSLIFGIISLIMAIIALILMQVNSNLKKLSDDKEGILRPEPVAFYKNKFYIALFSIVFFIVGGYFVTRGAIDFGRQKAYQPQQPIYYSHKVHAGINQINCLYCHGNAMESKHAAIPSVNVCMNCHKTINVYEKGPKLFDDDGNEINGTAEIEKLYAFAGFDPKNANAWDPSKAKPIPWIKIHNLPDHVYFNHSQHIKAGKVQCQSCHGEITNMDEVSQFAELSMGWCVNCHRNTKVDFYNVDSAGRKTGNKFYSIYEKFHNDIKSGKMDSVTVKDIGGVECQKCHY
jgi:mono/diheme cytochrome c family protein